MIFDDATLLSLVSFFLYTVFHKKHPLCFFYNSVEWWSIYMNFLADVAEE